MRFLEPRSRLPFNKLCKTLSMSIDSTLFFCMEQIMVNVHHFPQKVLNWVQVNLSFFFRYFLRMPDKTKKRKKLVHAEIF